MNKKILKSIIPEFVKDFLRKRKERRARRGGAHHIKDLRDLVIEQQAAELRAQHINPLNRHGKKCFSQTDEDGITIEILRRLGKLEAGTFAEFGVADGTENNTLILRALGWRGFWVGGSDLAFNVTLAKPVFSYFKEWVTADNICAIAKRGLDAISAKELDVVSLDLDGNDIYFVQRLLDSGVCPILFIVEYNAKFLPPIKWRIDYSDNHMWAEDDYFGASLSSFVELFEKHGYMLICCNTHTGSNAFFIKKIFAHLFEDVPKDIHVLHSVPRYYLPTTYGHKPSLKTLANLFR